MATNSTATVTIGCKLPHGLWLEVVQPGEMTQPRPAGVRVKLNGANTLRIQNPAGPTNPATAMYALTVVDKAFWDAWYARNKDLDFIKNGVVFVASDQKEAAAMSAERGNVRSGLEPITPGEVNQDARVKDIAGKVEPDAAQLKRLAAA
jgi:hypothetical protein